MQLHAYQLHDGRLELLAEDIVAGPLEPARDLGVADVDLAELSPDVVLGIGLEARAVADGDDARRVQAALARYVDSR